MIQNQCLHLKFVDFQKCNIDARLLHIFAIIDGYNDKGYKPGWHMTWVRFEKKCHLSWPTFHKSVVHKTLRLTLD